MDIQNQYPRRQPLDSSVDSEDIRYAAYREDHTSLRPSSDIYRTANLKHSVPPLSFLECKFTHSCWLLNWFFFLFHLDAWHKVTSVDPLADSDDDDDDGGGGDNEHAHYEYSKLLCMFFVISGWCHHVSTTASCCFWVLGNVIIRYLR